MSPARVVGHLSACLVGPAIVMASPAAAQPAAGPVSSLYDLKGKALTGSPVDLGAYRGKVAGVGNVGSRCG